MTAIDTGKYHKIIECINPFNIYGKVNSIVGLLVEGHNPGTSIGEICRIYPNGDNRAISAEVVGFRQGKVLLMPLKTLDGVGPGR